MRWYAFSYLLKIVYYGQYTCYRSNYKNDLLISNKMKRNKIVFNSNFLMELGGNIYVIAIKILCSRAFKNVCLCVLNLIFSSFPKYAMCLSVSKLLISQFSILFCSLYLLLCCSLSFKGSQVPSLLTPSVLMTSASITCCSFWIFVALTDWIIILELMYHFAF